MGEGKREKEMAESMTDDRGLNRKRKGLVRSGFTVGNKATDEPTDQGQLSADITAIIGREQASPLADVHL